MSEPPLRFRAGTDDSKLLESVQLIQSRIGTPPHWAMILGSGLGGVADRIDAEAIIPYEELPGFAIPKAAGHRGRLVIGRWHGVSVVAMAGRFHFYEGWSFDQITFPVSVMAALGAKNLIVSNAAGGVRPGLRIGDLVLITDSIDMMRGLGAGCPSDAHHLATSPGRLPDRLPHGSMTRSTFEGTPERDNRSVEVYSPDLRERALKSARENDIRLIEGAYLAMSGPTYETRAEYRMMRRMGVDVVGMSTVPEAIHGARLGMRVLGFSMVSNVANPDRPSTTTHDEVIEAGKTGAQNLQDILGPLRNW